MKLRMSSDHFITFCVYFCQAISIAKLLNTLPEYSSAVITSADSLIPELFTHNGKSQKLTICQAYLNYTVVLNGVPTTDLALQVLQFIFLVKNHICNFLINFKRLEFLVLAHALGIPIVSTPMPVQRTPLALGIPKRRWWYMCEYFCYIFLPSPLSSLLLSVLLSSFSLVLGEMLRT